MADDVRSLSSAEMQSSNDFFGTEFLDLPPDVIRNILTLPSLSLKDVFRLAQTCQKMNALLSDDCNDVWRAKHHQRWPDANKALLDVSPERDWQAECKLAYELAHRTVNIMEEVWPKVYMESEVCYSHYIPFRKIMEENRTAYFYIKEFLMGIIWDGDVASNLTQKYHAKRVLRYLRQEYLTYQLNKYKALPEDQQLLEIGVGYVAQWCQPLSEVVPEGLGERFNKLAELVLECLKESHPDHPILSFPTNERAKWQTENLPNDMWSARHCMEILYAMEEVLVNRLHYHGSKDTYHNRENYFIDAALIMHQGIPITINVIVESVARRLGVRTEPWNRGHFVLKWRSDFNNIVDDTGRVVYLDAFNSGGLIRPESYIGNGGGGGCPYRNAHCPEGAATIMEVIERLTAGIEVAGRMSMRNNGHSTHLRSALELMFVINPKNLTYILHLARLYILYSISVSELTESIISMLEELPSDVIKHAENILQMCQVYSPHQHKPPPEPQTRGNAGVVKYSVGMSMFHKQYNYICVITGWDPKCTATAEWKQEMGVNFLKNKDNQPFYNVLVPDGTYRYAAEENLEPLNASNHLNVINHHPDVGRYFESYKNGHYIPNHLKRAEYPEDISICRNFYGQDTS